MEKFLQRYTRMKITPAAFLHSVKQLGRITEDAITLFNIENVLTEFNKYKSDRTRNYTYEVN